MRRLLEFLFPPKSESAAIARERLKIVLAHERANRDAPDFLPALQKELLDVVSRYIEIRPDMIRVNLGKSGETSLLEINVEIGEAKAKPASAEAKAGIIASFEPAKPAPSAHPG
jgi:cell division topological specificity factor